MNSISPIVAVITMMCLLVFVISMAMEFGHIEPDKIETCLNLTISAFCVSLAIVIVLGFNFLN